MSRKKTNLNHKGQIERLRLTLEVLHAIKYLEYQQIRIAGGVGRSLQFRRAQVPKIY